MTENKRHIYASENPLVETLTHTLLYEGYSLFPYHRAAVKNQKPIPFGVIYPLLYNAYHPYSPGQLKVSCLIVGDRDCPLSLSARFLQLTDSVEVGWQATERNVDVENISIGQLTQTRLQAPFYFGCDKKSPGYLLPIRGQIDVECEKVNADDCFCLTTTIKNSSQLSCPNTVSVDRVLEQSLISTHIVIRICSGRFISAQNPDQNYLEDSTRCINDGLWPILVERDDRTMLCSPIILYDYPSIHPQSHTDLFDSTEIQEALMLHLTVMSEDEKDRIAKSDKKLANMILRAQELRQEDYIRLHGGMYESPTDNIT